METSAAIVQSAVEKAAVTYEEWFANGDPSWYESKTRHAFIEPILRALGWDTADPEVCHPEWRYKNNLRADYALFPHSTAQDFAAGMAVPAIIIEAKPVYRTDTGQRWEHGQAIWEEDIDQLQKYVDAEPGMSEGLAVFTNGRIWLLYLLEEGRRLRDIDPSVADIQQFDAAYNAEMLYEAMGRQYW